jgi:hypothetical protein
MSSIKSSNNQANARNFLRQFRDSKSKEFKELTAQQFSKIWSNYDIDGKIQMIEMCIINSLNYK